MARLSLINYIDPRKLKPKLAYEVQDELNSQAKRPSKRSSGNSVQVDKRTYQMLKDFKDKYDSYFYTSIRDSLILMSMILKQNKQD